MPVKVFPGALLALGSVPHVFGCSDFDEIVRRATAALNSDWAADSPRSGYGPLASALPLYRNSH
jgi:hypothetical protein